MEGSEESLASSLGGLWLLVALLLDALLLDCTTQVFNIWENRQQRQHELTDLLPAKSLGVGVEAEEDTLVAERVLVMRTRALLDFRVGRANDGLNIGAVDEKGDVGVGDIRGREDERIFQFRKA